MAAILDKYAIKEVADVMFYELDSKGAPSAPVLYLDTLKVSTISQSAETVDARGGKSNVKLLSWDTNKELTLELTDALFSAKSLGIMFGGVMYDNGSSQEVLKTLRANDIDMDGTDLATFYVNGRQLWIDKDKMTYFVYPTEGTAAEKAQPKAVATPQWTPSKNFDFVTFDLLDCTGSKTNRADGNGVIKDGITIDITAEFNANTYYITGDTYARNYQNGQDEFLQFIIPKGKVSAEDVSLTMEADGDPAEFTMTVQCLKAVDGSMVKLVKYSLGDSNDNESAPNKGVASVLDKYNQPNEHAEWASPKSIITEASYNQSTYVPEG